ncbi:MAG: hypothetical protein AVO33_03935 [delta proteobacterium ML8_F1]|nr:MAG: hypothetical protein AVO33_03935 [delta proteobacterium ML8_F1]
MSLLAAYLTPHPPLIIPLIGRGEEKKIQRTIDSMEEVGRRIAALKPKTIVFITPHGPMFSDGIGIYSDPQLEGDFHRFGENTLSFSMGKDDSLIRQFQKEMHYEGIATALIDKESAREYRVSNHLDHGILVPLYFIQKYYKDFQGVGLTYGLFSYGENYRVGAALGRAIEKNQKSTVIIAIGDLSHRLKEEGPYSYHPDGPEFDNQLQEKILTKNHLGIVTMSPTFCEKAGECGKRSVDMLLGALDQSVYTVESLSYEGPFGVGYAVMAFEDIRSGGDSILEEIVEDRRAHVARKRSSEDIHVRLARETIETYVRTHRVLDPSKSPYGDCQCFETKDFGAFVSIKNSHGLRGCIGTYRPTKKNLGEEIIHSAIAAATEDPRFEAITKEELGDLVLSVDLVHPPKSAAGIEDLDPLKFGVIVRSGYKSGLLLPNLEGVDTPEEQLRIVLGKAGIREHESYEIEIFEVERYE